MFTKKALAFLSINLLLCSSIFASNVQDDEATRGKCKKFNSLTVCNSVTANSFITPSGPLFNGLRNWALFENTLGVSTGDNVLWNASSADKRSSGISVDTTTGEIRLPIGGTFLVIYFTQFNLPFTIDVNQSNTGNMSLFQGSSTIPNQRDLISLHVLALGTNITAAIRQTASGIDIVKTTSSSDNILFLEITLEGAATCPVALSNNTNAQMIILQLN